MKKGQSSEWLFYLHLQYIYDVEIHIEKTLPKIIKAASNIELRTCFEIHLEETSAQRARIEEIFEMIGSKPKKKKSEGIRGVILDSQNTLNQIAHDGLSDIYLAMKGRLIEKFEIGLYETAIDLATKLEYTDMVTLLEETLGEEHDTDTKLTSISLRLPLSPTESKS